eukprot:Hpha_TRINITY_DN15262_c1_g14::TRINITY_DN15262_c1_g14_i1::g.64310::m.64310
MAALLGTSRSWSSVGPNEKMPSYNSTRDPHLRIHHTAEPVRRHMRKMTRIESQETRRPDAEAKLAWRMVIHEMYATPQRARRQVPTRPREKDGAGSARRKEGEKREQRKSAGSSRPEKGGKSSKGSLPPIKQGRDERETDATSKSSKSSKSSRSGSRSSSPSRSRSRSRSSRGSESPRSRSASRSSGSKSPRSASQGSKGSRSDSPRSGSEPGPEPDKEERDRMEEKAPSETQKEKEDEDEEKKGEADDMKSGSYDDGDDYGDDFENTAGGGSAALSSTYDASPTKTDADPKSPGAGASGLPDAEVDEWVQKIRGVAAPDNAFKMLSKACKVTDELYLGGEKAALNVTALKDLGVARVINCAPSQCKKVGPQNFEGSGIQYSEIDADDAEGYPLLQNHLPQVLSILEAADGGGTLIHCFQGVNRSATLLIAALMVRGRTPILDAVRTAHAGRPIILQGNDGFVRQLVHLAHKEDLLEPT